MATEDQLHQQMRTRDALLGMLGGAGAGLAAAHKVTPGSALTHGALPLAGMVAGGLVGGQVGKERGLRDKLKQERHLGDVERAQEHRKELVTMRKKASSFDGAVLAAMADELAHLPTEKVAINLAPVGNVLGQIGSRALSGVTSLASRASPQISQAVSGGLLRAGQAVGGGANLSKLVGGGLAGAGALGAANMASRAVRPQPRGY